MPQVDAAPTAAGPSPEGTLALGVATRWAEAVKAQAIYPAGHHRTAAALLTLEEALEAAGLARAGAPPLRLLFSDGGLVAAGERLPVEPDGPLAWLRERLDAAGLAGLDVAAAPDLASFEALGRRLLEIHATRDPHRDPLAAWAGLSCPGLTPLDRRFEGVFSDAPDAPEGPQRTWGRLGARLTPREQLRWTGLLRSDPAIRRRLHAIQRRLAERGGPEGERLGVDLLQRVTGLLPARSADDAPRMHAVAGGLLDALEQRLESEAPASALHAFFEDPALERRVAFLCTALFQREVPPVDPASAEQSPRPQGHAGDERVADDLAAFLFELDGLPPWTPPPEDELESAGEEVGALLHVLRTRPEAGSLPGLLPALAAMLAAPDPDVVRALRQALHIEAGRADAAGPSAGVRRIVEALAGLGHARLLRAAGHLSPERITEAFPADALLWLDALDLAEPADRAELAAVLAAVGGERLNAAAPGLLTDDGLLAPRRLARLLATEDALLAPLVRLVFTRGGLAPRAAVLDWLRRVAPPGLVAAPLSLVEVPTDLPDAYVDGVLGLLEGRPAEPALEAQAVRQLIQVVDATAGREDRRARRIQALRHLATSARPEAWAIVRRVAYGRRWLVVPLEERAVRLAARDALTRAGAA